MTDETTTFEERLRSACSRGLGTIERVEELKRLSGGASQETWSFNAVTAADAHPLVLRRSAPGFPEGIGSAIPMELEARLIARAAAAGAAVPQIVAVLNEADGLGEGFVSRFIAGETLGGRICKHPDLAGAREVFVAQCAAQLAAIHAIDPAEIDGLTGVTPQSELNRLRDAHDLLETPRPVYAMAIAWLQQRMIDPVERPVLVHGDFRNGNMIVGPEGVRAVLDWEAAHSGDPAEDVAWFCAPSWRFGQMDRPAGGIGSKEEWIEEYETRSGTRVDCDRMRFWDAFSILRWGLMCASAEIAFSSSADGSPQRGIIARRSSESELELLRLILPRG